MKLKAICENTTINISVGTGLRDITWLACAVANIYGRSKHISYNLIPSLLKVGQDVPHPR